MAKYTVHSSIVHIVFITLDLLQIFAYYFELPLKLIDFFINNNFVNKTNTDASGFTNEAPYANYIKHFSLYYYYRKNIIRKTEIHLLIYPDYLLYLILGVYSSFIISFALIVYQDNISQNPNQTNSKTNCCSIAFKLISINFFHFVFFHLMALCIYDTCFNLIINALSYLEILIFLLIVVLVLTYYYYFSSFCACVKFDNHFKQLNNLLGRNIDNTLLLIKILISLEVNYTQKSNEQLNSIGFFFIIINISTLLFLLSRLLSKTTEFTDCYKCIGLTSFLLSFIFGCLFPYFRSSAFAYFLCLFLVFLLPSLLIIILRKRRITQIIRSKENPRLKFTLLFEYYQTKHFSSMLSKVVLNESKHLFFNIDNEEKVFKAYLIHLKHKLKEESKRTKSFDTLFYYILLKIYIVIINKECNTFAFIFKITKSMNKIKKSSQLYYFNIYYFYNILQYDINNRGTGNGFQLNHSFYKLLDEINHFIISFELFIQKEAINTPSDYFQFSSLFTSFVKKAKKHYGILDHDKTEEYQKLLFRIMIETIRNKSIQKQEDKFELFIKDEIFNQEDLLEKDYLSGNMIKLKIDSNTLNCTILKIGHQLNYLNCKNFFNLFPVKFRKIATELFYSRISKKNAIQDVKQFRIENFEKFQFFVKDQNDNSQEFLLLYKLYPDLSNDIIYLDGKYTLSNEGFIITETMFNQEKIVLISNKLSKMLYVDQEYLALINRYQAHFSLSMFNADLISYFSNRNILNALLKQIKTLMSVVSIEDNNKLSQMHQKFNLKKSNESCLIKFELKYSLNQKDNVEAYNFYRVLRQNTSTNQSKCINTLDPTLLTNKSKSYQKQLSESNEEKKMKAELMTAYDTRSVSSSMSKSSISVNHRGSSIKKKNDKKDINSANVFVMIFNILIIILSIILLIIENRNNHILSEHVELFQIINQLNKVMLNSVISFYSLICYNNSFKNPDADWNCINRFTKYLNELGLEPLERFAKKELAAKLEVFHSQWDVYKKKATNLNNNKIRTIMQKPSQTFHLSYSDGKFIYKSTNAALEEALTVYISKMTMISLIDNFDKIDIYPLYVNDALIPLYFEDQSIILSTSQLEIYETLFSFYDYAIELFYIQNEILVETNIFIANVLNSIIIFIAVLIFLNGLLFFIFLMIFHHSNKTIRAMMIKIDMELKTEDNLQRLTNKILVLKDLAKLYKENPIKLVHKIKATYKNNSTKKGENKFKSKDKGKEKTSDISITQTSTKKYNLSFVTKDYLLTFLVIEIVYISFCLIFLALFILDFNEIKLFMFIMQKSGLGEELIYLSISSMQMMEFSNITEYTLYNKLFQKEEVNGKFFESMVNILQEARQNEDAKKLEVYSIYNKSFNHTFSYDCETIYTTLNDSRMYKIIQSNPKENFEELLKQFCNEVKILRYNNEKKFFNEIVYNNMKLAGKLKTNSLSINLSKDTNELYYLVAEVLFIYRPLKAYIGDFFFIEVPNFVLDKHFVFLLLFLIINIAIQIINFLIYKFRIIDRIENDIHNLKDVKIALSV